MDKRDFVMHLQQEGIMNRKLIEKRPNSNKWYLCFYNPNKNGTPKRFRTATPFEHNQQKQAEQYAQEIFAKCVIEQNTRDIFADITFNEALQEYISWKPRSAKDIGQLNMIAKVIGNKDLKTINRKDYNKLITQWRVKNNKNTSINRKLDLLKAVLNFAKNNEYILSFPKINKLPTNKEKLSYRYTETDIQTLLSHMTGEYSFLIDPFIFAYRTGLRMSNIQGLTKQHIHQTLNGWEMRFRSNEMKSKRAFSLPLTKSLKEIIDRNWHTDTDYIFKGYKERKCLGDFKNSFNTIRKQANIINPKKGRLAEWRDLRGTRASDLAERGVGVYDLMTFMDWSSIEIAQRYVETYAHNRRSILEKIDTETDTIINTCNAENVSYNDDLAR